MLSNLNVCSLPGKTHAIFETLEVKRPVVLVLSETWHHSNDHVCLRRAAPPGYSVVAAVRESDPAHGGLVVYHRSQYSCSAIKLPRLSSFEGLCLRIGTPGQTFVLLSVYRPGSCQPSQLFYDELDAVLESLVVHGCPVIIGGRL